jgi:PIN domain nuclease of toxin-antitoxin system
VNVLLDTCALLALTRGELPRAASKLLRAAPEANVSSVAAWEVAIKVSSGKLVLSKRPAEWYQELITRYALQEIPLDHRVACAAAALPLIHRDPFDRVLVALSQMHSLVILTSDEAIPRYPGIHAIWQ